MVSWSFLVDRLLIVVYWFWFKIQNNSYITYFDFKIKMLKIFNLDARMIFMQKFFKTDYQKPLFSFIKKFRSTI